MKNIKNRLVKLKQKEEKTSVLVYYFALFYKLKYLKNILKKY